MDAQQPGDTLAADIEAIEIAARDMGIRPGDPAFPFMQGLSRLLRGLGQKLDAHTVREDALLARIEQAKGLSPEGEKALVRDVSNRAGQAVAMTAKGIARSTLAWAITYGVLGCAAFGIVCFMAGRWTTDERVNARISATPTPGFWAQLAELNDPARTRSECLTHATTPDAIGGYYKCNVDLWIKAPPVPPPEKKAAAR